MLKAFFCLILSLAVGFATFATISGFVTQLHADIITKAVPKAPENTMHLKITNLNPDKEIVEFNYEGERHVYFMARFADGSGVALSKVGVYKAR